MNCFNLTARTDWNNEGNTDYNLWKGIFNNCILYRIIIILHAWLLLGYWLLGWLLGWLLTLYITNSVMIPCVPCHLVYPLHTWYISRQIGHFGPDGLLFGNRMVVQPTNPSHFQCCSRITAHISLPLCRWINLLSLKLFFLKIKCPSPLHPNWEAALCKANALSCRGIK